MKKLLKFVLGTAGVLLVLAIALVVVLPFVFDPNDHKQSISEAVQSSMGREVRLDGEIKWSVFPHVALSFRDVKLANEAGFKGEYMVEMTELSAQVKLLPLLRKEIKVGTVSLVKPHINLQVAKSGQSNWQGMLDALNAGDSPSQSAGGSSDLQIRGIEVVDGLINYTDRAAGMEVALSGVQFQSSELTADKESTIDIQAHVAMPNEGLNGDLDVNFVLHNALNDQGMRIHFNTLQFDGRLSAASKLPLQIAADEPGTLDLAKETLAFERLSASLGPMAISTSLAGQNVTSDMALSGSLELNPFDLDEFLSALDAPLVNEANNELSGQAKWSLKGGQLSINDLSVNLDEYALKGAVNINDLSQMKGTFDLSMDAFDANPYIPQSNDANTKGQTGPGAALDYGRLNGRVAIGQLKFAGLTLDNITLNLATQGPDFSVQPLEADFYQGLIKTEIKLKPQQKNNRLHVSHRMADIQAGGMLTDLMGSEYMTGLGQLNADLSIDEPFSERPFKTAHGQLHYRLTDGDIVGIDVFDIIQKSLSLLGNQEAVSQTKELKTAFGLMEVDASVEQGVLTTQRLKLTSPYFDVKGQVSIDLDAQTIRGTIKPMLTNIPEGVLSDDYKKLLNLRIPVALSGNLLEPEISIDVKELILESQKEKIEEKKEELKQDLFDQLLGTDNDKKGKDKKRKNKNQQSESGSNEGADSPEMTEKQKRRARKKAQQRALLEGLLGSGDEDEDQDNGDEDGDTDNRP